MKPTTEWDSFCSLASVEVPIHYLRIANATGRQLLASFFCLAAATSMVLSRKIGPFPFRKKRPIAFYPYPDQMAG